MRTLLLSVALATIGCATAPRRVHVVDIQGRAVTTTARLDALGAEATLHCGVERYVVVPRERPFMMGAYVGTRTADLDPATTCERIRAN